MKLTNEEIFVAVYESGSLKAAAERLNTDPSSVSRKITALERHLGVALLKRSTSRSTPTEAGELYYRGLRKLIDEKTGLEAMVANAVDTPQGTLRITAPVYYGTHFVTPVLERMRRQFPGLGIEVLLGRQYEDIATEGVDVAIRVGKLPDSSLICRKLGDIPRILVASTNYLKNQPAINIPQDLAPHNFIFYSRTQMQEPLELIGESESIRLDVKGNIFANSVLSVRQFVLAGFGLHHGAAWVFQDELESGELVQVLPEYQLNPYPIHALYSATAYVPAKIRMFIDEMVEQTRTRVIS